MCHGPKACQTVDRTWPVLTRAVCIQGVVGMVLDLTNSDKYYDPNEFVSRNVRYVKVCPLLCWEVCMQQLLHPHQQLSSRWRCAWWWTCATT